MENNRKPKPFLKTYQSDTMFDNTNAYNRNFASPSKSSLPNQNFFYPPKPPIYKPVQSWKSNLPSMPKNSNTRLLTSANSNSASVNQLPQGERRPPKPCFRCGERYFPRHTCKAKIVMAVQVKEIESEANQEVGQEVVLIEQIEDSNDERTLSVHVLRGSQGANTITMLGNSKNRQLVVLIDSGSTNSFLDEKIAEELRLPIIASHISLTVVDGRRITSFGFCKALSGKSRIFPSHLT